ncbi:MAG TPA: beta-galactosidase [Vicinamibacteria bacterium]|nr:beta-galactosidase [Vicinamibacteria bacterium]
MSSLAAIALSLIAAIAVPEPPPAPHRGWIGKGLFVGTCYQPVDRSPEEIRRDVALMRAAGFTLVRMGDLSWDSFEPSEGAFQFAWFDEILKLMNEAGIKVVLDIAGLPAPTWLHHRYPSANVVDQNGVVLQPARRYMEDISDPVYREHVRRYAEALTSHYAGNPAVIAVGYDNEIGDGYLSYSAADRARFVEWLKDRYRTVEALNAAWATQRWSRRLGSFDDVQLPYGEGPSPPERYLDLRRFWSDQTIGALRELDAIRRKNMPDLPSASNLWDTAPRRGFDYLSSYRDYASHGAMGYYPGTAVDTTLLSLLVRGELPTPVWFTEFITAGSDGYGPPKGSIRMWAYHALLHFGQVFLAWTFNTHRGGEEQALFGILDHDGTRSWKYQEWKRIAEEFSKLGKLGFPRGRRPEVAIAYSFDTAIASRPPVGNTARDYYSTPYFEQVSHAFQPLYEDNVDVALLNLANSSLEYKLLVVPGLYVMDERSAAALRRYVGGGGTVVMTAFSAKVDEHSQWFDSPLPGRLADVFGIRTSEFYRAGVLPEASFDGGLLKASLDFYEVLEPRTARTLATLTNTPERSPAITVNDYGKGHAIYVAVPAQRSFLGPLLRSLYSSLGVERGPSTPTGVCARMVEGRTLYVNSTAGAVDVPIAGTKDGVISGRKYSGVLPLEPYGAELLQ